MSVFGVRWVSNLLAIIGFHGQNPNHKSLKMKEEKLKLVVVGISHKTAPISILELFQLSNYEIQSALKYFQYQKYFKE